MEEKKIRIAIIEDNEKYSGQIEQAFQEEGTCEVIGAARDGKAGLDLVLSREVDAALIETVLPVMDGLFILEELKNFPEKKPVCVMLSEGNLESVTRHALQLGADYFILKPFDTALMVKRVIEVYRYKKQSSLRAGSQMAALFPKTSAFVERDPESFVHGVLHNIPISTHLKGYTYLKEAIALSISNGKMLHGVTKILYPTVAQVCQTTPTRVERAIRHAIETAWSKGYGHNYCQLMGFPDLSGRKPTNSQFISAVTDLYKTGLQAAE
ncbi:MAG: sporulation transcription factor Spo0A [Clostridiales bacterium]|jgi:two-component system response regulator (stage 0 sporulation protein A)|nr:sporulation transcription factor Spo0A [Clostridiales bacterium]